MAIYGIMSYLLFVLVAIGVFTFTQALTTGAWGVVLLGLISGTVIYFVVLIAATAIEICKKKHNKK